MEKICGKTKDKFTPEELYRIYEYSSEAFYPESDFRCGTLQNYVDCGILTEEEVSSLWKTKEKKK